jgi:glycosyltransferase involved in cell wall biosynthesis
MYPQDLLFQVDDSHLTAETVQDAEHLPQWVVAVIPAYNEERFIGSVVLKARRYAQKVIVVDDGSKDNTAQLAAAAGAEVIRHGQNAGKGAALTTGLLMAKEYNPDVVVLLDADGQHCPEELPRVVKPIVDGEADIVVGSRYLEKTSDVPHHRVWGHWAFNWLTRSASGVNASDSQSGFRAFSPKAMEAITFKSSGFSVESEMQFIAHENHLRLVEVPITIRYTDKPKRPVFKHGLMVLNGMLRMVGQYRPLLYFGGAGLILLGVGLVVGIDVVNRFQRVKQLAMGHAMISIMVTIVGVLSLSTGIILHSIRGLLLEFMEKLREHS